MSKVSTKPWTFFMPKNYRFTYLCDQEDLGHLDLIARELRISRSDAARFAAREKARELAAERRQIQTESANKLGNRNGSAKQTKT